MQSANPSPVPATPAASVALGSSQQLHLFVADSIGGEFQPRPVPPGVSRLATQRMALSSPVAIESFVNRQKHPRLLVSFPADSAPQVNGSLAPRRVVLRAGDFCQWPGIVDFYVAIFNRPQVGPPAPDQVGSVCLVCRLPCAADSVCYTCACGALLHCEEALKGGLPCAQSRSDCPRCRRPVVLKEGYENAPNNE